MTLSPADFELLLQANRILSSKLDVGEVLEAVMELAAKVVRAEAASLLLLDAERDELTFDIALGADGDQVKQIRIKVGEGIAGWVAAHQAPLIVNDVARDPRFTTRVDKSTSFQTRSILAVPLRAKGRLIGVVEAINKEHFQDFTTHDQEALGVFASQAGIAIENARLFSEVSREKKKLDAVFSRMSDGVLYLDAAGTVMVANAAAAQYLGLAEDAAVGRPFGPDLFPGFAGLPALRELAGLGEAPVERDLTRAGAKDFVLSAFFHRIGREDGSVEGWLVVLRDVTAERKGERLKRDFLSLISHKLKTPLTVILGYGPMLLAHAESLTDAQKKAAQTICEQGDHLSGLVDKLLRFSIVEAGHLERDPARLVLEEVVVEAVNAVPEGIRDGANITVDGAIAHAPVFFADRRLTVEVLRNLVENAVKFNPGTEKTVRIACREEGGRIVITIADNGPGIPPEERQRIFEKFYQIENSFTGQVPGAGLGLAFCKRVVEEMGGTITVASGDGAGAVFSVALPAG